ncbi:MAG: hypothetical protein V1918_10225 [Planctomycetota bacterium]
MESPPAVSPPAGPLFEGGLVFPSPRAALPNPGEEPLGATPPNPPVRATEAARAATVSEPSFYLLLLIGIWLMVQVHRKNRGAALRK